MKKKEASFQTVFNQYLRKKKMFGYFELKQTIGDSLPFSDVKQHQLDGLRAAHSNGFVWKLSDEDSREKPFDCMYTTPLMGYVVIKYPGVFYIINVYHFLAEKDLSKRKSLTKTRAKEICVKEVRLSTR